MLAIYTDGGTFIRNPSPWGGAWAYRYVEHFEDPNNDKIVWWDAGILYPNQDGIQGYGVTNNHTEFYALLSAIEHVNRGWEGKVCSDSLLTLCRFFIFRDKQKGLWPTKNIPEGWVDRRDDALKKLGKNILPILLSGHPTQENFRTGIGKRGTPVSVHNQWCDKKCNSLAKEWREKHGR